MRTLTIILIILAVAATGCAWEEGPAEQERPQPEVIPPAEPGVEEVPVEPAFRFIATGDPQVVEENTLVRDGGASFTASQWLEALANVAETDFPGWPGDLQVDYLTDEAPPLVAAEIRLAGTERVVSEHALVDGNIQLPFAPGSYDIYAVFDWGGHVEKVAWRVRLVQLVDEEHLLAAFDRAELVSAWCRGAAQIPIGSQSQTLGQREYFQVEVPGLDSASRLREYLDSLFSSEQARLLLSRETADGYNYLRDIEGSLYALAIEEPSPVRLERDLSLDWTGKTEITISLMISGPDAAGKTIVANCDYVYRLSDDGAWRFQDFPLPAAVWAAAASGK